jgi:8-oxo-dGTP pyrophosphatase MutT (NUDIX family)
LLVRDRGALEVLMVERHADMRFGPGALVFPGGKLDAQDVDPAWSAHALGWAGLDDEARGLRICAIRETFEETGILLANGLGRQNGSAVEDVFGLRSAVACGDVPFLEVVKTSGLWLDLHALIPFARWVTPTRQPIRFDATFFIAPAPEGQAAVCDTREIVAADWLRPAKALSLADMAERKLMRPTRANLMLLAADACVRDALASAIRRPVVTILQDD